jgi:hypothetical protein
MHIFLYEMKIYYKDTTIYAFKRSIKLRNEIN